MKNRILKKILAVMISVLLIVPTWHLNSKADGEYTIEVNVTMNVVTVYQYGNPVKAMVCSTGTSTPRSGTYRTTDKYEWRSLVGGVSGQYATRITGQILFHSVPYTRYGDKSSLEYWEYDKLGNAASLGCVRLSVEDAKWIYDNCPRGTGVTFITGYSAPLGKPSSCAISNASSELRGWDPTDPDPNNPWNYKYQDYCFDANFYYNNYSDLRSLIGNDEDALRIHWLANGIREGRQGSEEFDVTYYKNTNSDLQAIYGDDNYAYVNHYLTSGRNERRQGSANKKVYIKGKCQMPYTGEGGGYLIGVESFENPNQSYRYEMLILDCTLLAENKTAWIYSTGQCGVAEGNALWTIWQPQYGYYWTLFRVFDENGNMLDEACFGFVNAY
ncbi:MAG: L,D-transpeptidase [Lachnospiraceae bacterium]|nr:L,D-transpeptidase [Lachnospiraceae bacterium]